MSPSRILLCLIALPGLLRAQAPSKAELREQAVSAFRESRLSDAEESLRRLLKQTPNDADTLGFLAAVLDAENRFAEAEGYYTQALALAPGSITLLNNAGNHYAAKGDTAQARKLFLRVVMLNPQQRNANLQLARMAVNEKHGALAIGYLQHLNNGSEDFAIQLLRAEALYWAGDKTKSQRALRELRSATEGDAAKLTALGLTFGRLEQWDSAEETFLLALQAGPSTASVLYNLGLAAARGRHWDRARSAFESTLKLDPDDVQTIMDLAWVYAAQGDFAAATQVLLEARKRSPDNPQVLLELARTLEALKLFGDAAVVYDEYLRLVPNDHAAERDRAFSYAGSGRPGEGLAQLQSYSKRFPNDAEALFKLGMVTADSDLDQALGLLTRSLELNSNLLQARFARALVLGKLGRFPEAIVDLEIVGQSMPDNPDVNRHLGVNYLAVGHPAKAVAVLRLAQQESPGDSATLVSLGRALKALGKDEEARAVFAKLANSFSGRTLVGSPIALELSDLPPTERLERYTADLESAAQLRPADVGIRLQLGAALFETHRNADAISVLGGLSPEADHRYLVAAARMALAYGETDLARSLIASVEDDTPLFHVTKAQLFDAENNLSEARAELSRAFAVDPLPSNLAEASATLLLKWNDTEEATKLLEKAVATDPRSQPLAVAQAIALERSGQILKSETLFRVIETRWPESGRAFLVHSAMLAGRGNYQAAAKMLSRAEALGEMDTSLSKCVEARDCPLPTVAQLMR
jgi:Flp pilus assembly protein TadD